MPFIHCANHQFGLITAHLSSHNLLSHKSWSYQIILNGLMRHAKSIPNHQRNTAWLSTIVRTQSVSDVTEINYMKGSLIILSLIKEHAKHSQITICLKQCPRLNLLWLRLIVNNTERITWERLMRSSTIPIAIVNSPLWDLHLPEEFLCRNWFHPHPT